MRFGSSGALIGVVTDPAASPSARGRPAIILLGAGLVHRVGPHRLYVKLARQLAQQGFVVFRFDFSGIGDSGVRADALPLKKSAVLETLEAMDWLASARSIDRFVLMAVCSGAGFSFQTACADPRVIGVSLINAAGHRWGGSDELNRTLIRHYVRMLRSASFRRNNVRKLIRLGFDYRTITRAFLGHLKKPFSVRRKAVQESGAVEEIVTGFRALMTRSVRVLIVYSEGDEGWDYYQLFLRSRLRELLASDQVQIQMIEGANHTFTLVSHQRRLFNILGRWAEELH